MMSEALLVEAPALPYGKPATMGAGLTHRFFATAATVTKVFNSHKQPFLPALYYRGINLLNKIIAKVEKLS